MESSMVKFAGSNLSWLESESIHIRRDRPRGRRR